MVAPKTCMFMLYFVGLSSILPSGHHKDLNALVLFGCTCTWENIDSMSPTRTMRFLGNPSRYTDQAGG